MTALHNLHAGGLHSLAALRFLLLNGVTLLELTTLNFVDVHEQVLATTFRLNEAVSFLIEKTSNFTFSHNLFL